jgi:SAM-dependent methyltransferase
MHDHAVDGIAGIPICLAREGLGLRRTADPGDTLPEAIAFAERMSRECATYAEALECFLAYRAPALPPDELALARRRLFARTVGTSHDAIRRAARMLARRDRALATRGRFHIDVGCGMGFETIASAKSVFGDRVIGIDLSPHYLVMAKRLAGEHGVGGASFVCADISEGWPIAIADLDVAFISMEGVLEHVKDVPGFFAALQSVRSFPLCIYLTVPWRWSIRPESHYNLRFIGLMPPSIRDAYLKRRLGVETLDPIELYSAASLRAVLERYFAKEAIALELNASLPWRRHYLRACIDLRGPGDIRD